MFHSTFRQLEVFVAVVDDGSFASGAERLAISHPAISNHIRAWNRRSHDLQLLCYLVRRDQARSVGLNIALLPT
jgi:hypothetical protein